MTFYNEVVNDNNLDSAFKLNVGEMLEKANTKNDLEKIKQNVNNYNEKSIDVEKVDKTTQSQVKNVQNPNTQTQQPTEVQDIIQQPTGTQNIIQQTTEAQDIKQPTEVQNKTQQPAETQDITQQPTEAQKPNAVENIKQNTDEKNNKKIEEDVQAFNLEKTEEVNPDELMTFYNEVTNDNSLDSAFKLDIGEMIEKANTKNDLEDIKQSIKNYKEKGINVEERNQNIKKVSELAEVLSTKGLEVSKNQVLDAILNNVDVTRKGNQKALSDIINEVQTNIREGTFTSEKISQIVETIGDKLKTETSAYYDALKDLKKEIRTSSVYVSPEIRRGFSHWNEFFKSNLGTLKITNNKNDIDVDILYNQLQSEYGKDMFPDDIYNQIDRLEKISEVSKSIKKDTETLYKQNKSNWDEITKKLTNDLENLRTMQPVEEKENTATQLEKRRWTKTAKENEIVKEFLNVKDMNYEVASNVGTVKKANEIIKTLGYEKALESFQSKLGNHSLRGAEDIALGERLIQESMKRGDFTTARNMIYDVAILGTELGQQVQALSLIKRMSPEGQLLYLKKIVDRMNEKQVKSISKAKSDISEDISKNTKLTTEEADALTDKLIEESNKLPTKLNKEGKKVYDFDKIKEMTTKIVEGMQTSFTDKMSQFSEEDKENLRNKITKIVTGKQEMLEEAKPIVFSDDVVNAILSSETADELENAIDRAKQQIANQLKATKIEKWNEWRYLSMLGNPKTHIRNIAGNVGMRAEYEMKNVVQRAIETGVNKIIPLEERTRTFEKASEDVKQFAKQCTKDNKELISGGGKMNTTQEIESMKKIFNNKYLEGVRKFNNKMLDFEDAFFGQTSFSSTLAEYLTANGIKTKKDIDTHGDIIDKGINYAIKEARKTTFRQASKLSAMLNVLEHTNGFSELVMGGILPFKKTPINIVKNATAYSPIGLIESLTNQSVQLKKGNITVNEYIDRISQGLTGSALFGLGAWLAKLGILSGSEDDKYKEELGNSKGYSLRIGNKNFDISWLSPSSVPLLMGAELVNSMNNDGKLDWDNITETLNKTIDPLSETTMLSSLNSAIKSYSSDNAIGGAIGEMISNSVQSYFLQAFPTLGNQVARVVDKTKRSTRASANSINKKAESTVRQIMNKIPGLSMLLEEQVDVWGNTKTGSNSVLGRIGENFILPSTVTKDKTSNIDKEILRLGEEAEPNMNLKNYFSVNNNKYEMSAKEYTQFKKDYGNTAYQGLEKLMDSKEYQDMTDEEKIEAVKEVYSKAVSTAREKYGYNIKDLIDKYGEVEAIDRYLNENLKEKYKKIADDISIIDFVNAYESQSGVGATKNIKGESISGTTKANKIKAMTEATNLNKYKIQRLYNLFSGK